MYKANFLHKQTEEMEQNLLFVDNEIRELQNYRDNLNLFSNSKENSIIASMGKGIHVQASLDTKDLFVEVGAGVVLKKKPQEAVKIIETQLKKLVEARMQLVGKLDIYQKTLENVMLELEDQEKLAQNK